MTDDTFDPPAAHAHDRPGAAVGVSAQGPWAAGLGALLALGSTALLPMHLGGAGGGIVGVGFAAAAVLLAYASVSWGAAAAPGVDHRPRYWALAGAMGLLISGVGLVADLLDMPMILSEVLAVAVVGAWWTVLAVYNWRTRDGRDRGRNALAAVSLGCALGVVIALVAQFTWSVPPGAAPVRMAYVLWGPWGLALAYRLRALRTSDRRGAVAVSPRPPA